MSDRTTNIFNTTAPKLRGRKATSSPKQQNKTYRKALQQQPPSRGIKPSELDLLCEAAQLGGAEDQYKFARRVLNEYSEETYSSYFHEGAKQNRIVGVHYLELAAEQEYHPAFLLLGTHLLDGKDCAVDAIRGERLITTVADEGDIRANEELGRRYLSGRGVPRHYVKSYERYLIAETLGHKKNEEIGHICYSYSGEIAELERKITRVNIRQAQEKAAELFKRIQSPPGGSKGKSPKPSTY